MQIKSKWTMWGHFNNLCFKTFLMASWGPNLVFVCLSNQGLNIRNSHTSATPVHLRVIGFPPCTLGLMGPYITHLVTNPMLNLLRWSKKIWKFWKFMIYIRFIICSPLCLILISSLCGVWKTMWDVKIIFVLLMSLMQMW
jgi:hypothetical protein